MLLPELDLAAKWAERHPSTKHFAALFSYSHLPSHLATVSGPFSDLAVYLVERLPDGPELSAGLRKLVEAKDCMVRAAVAAPPVHPGLGGQVRELNPDGTTKES